MIAEDQFFLLWKGRQTGPFSLERIREMLVAADISRMHQINVDGRWQILDEYLEKLRAADVETKRAEEQQMREAEMKRQIETQLNGDRAKREEERTPLSQALPPAAPFGNSSAAADPFGTAAPFPPAHSRVSAFAIAALVMGVFNFIPYVNFVSWILALVFGHVALFQMNADESLKGRGMAIAGLAITYFLLVMTTTAVVLCIANNKPLPIHF